jgi:hypothetical protein
MEFILKLSFTFFVFKTLRHVVVPDCKRETSRDISMETGYKLKFTDIIV